MAKDSFDYIEDNYQPQRKQASRSGMVWNILTVIVLLSTACVAIVILTIFINPYRVFNPFPPPTKPVVMKLDSLPTEAPTSTPRSILPPTWTPTSTIPPTLTNTPEPTPTDIVVEQPPELPVAPEQPTEGMPFVMQEGSPQPINGANFHPDLGCKWMGVAGAVLDITGAPLASVIIRLGGMLDGQEVDELGISGMSPSYGQAGYEFTLAGEPMASNQTLWLQLLDQAGLPLSDKTYFDTYDSCDQNLILIYFKQVK